MVVFQTLLVLMTLLVLRSTDQVFRRMSLNCDLSDVCHMIGLGLWIFMKIMEVKCYFDHIIQGCILSI